MKVRAGEVRAGEVRAGEVRAGEVRAGEVRMGEVDDGCGTVMGGVAGAYNRQGGLDVGWWLAGSRTMYCGDAEEGGMGWFGGSHVGVVADKCAQHGDDGGLVTGGVLHDALQCVDAAEPDVHRGGAEVGDGSVIPVGDLSLLGDLKLAICRIFCCIY